jgi:hypothetical protein
MNKLLLFTSLSIIFTSCEKEEGYINPQSFLEVSSNLNYDGNIYVYDYPVGQSSSYFEVNFQTLSQERIYWNSPDLFYVIVHNDTIWDECVNYSTFANNDGEGRQLIYVNPQFIGDTLNIIAQVNNYGNKITKEILVKIQ